MKDNTWLIFVLWLLLVIHSGVLIHVDTPAAAIEHKPMGAARSISTAKSSAVPDPPTLTTDESRRIFRQLVATIQACQAAEPFPPRLITRYRLGLKILGLWQFQDLSNSLEQGGPLEHFRAT